MAKRKIITKHKHQINNILQNYKQMKYFKKQQLIKLIIAVFVLVALSEASCHKINTPDIVSGKLIFTFEHSVGENSLQIDTMKYVNAAGNPYLVTGIQYFISDICLHKANGDSILLDKWNDIHYVDTDLPETWDYFLKDSIPQDDYSSVSFTFGINAEKNKSLLFVNPPESNMFWPEYLGGGYHYMKLNGKWRDTSGVIRLFNVHIGIGQIYDSTGHITRFVQNFFKVQLSSSAFSIAAGQSVEITLNMDVNEWFESPEIFNFNVWGGGIMQKQVALHIVCLNGHNVFSVKDIKTLIHE